ncbi:MAG: type II toxin-antitoxin system PemK/MazF family toxin [Actinobacteria bacterium]|nr:type II toxin-antitoxin system PemK/MazF family toxin [Actinomycetota bacterium]MCL6087075.1 type II toxin-antitoxin system PemK/MazF family toxin [Actinomycetota bacterium]
MTNYPKRGEIWLVSLEPVTGHEIGKTRPALIISNDKNNEYSSTVTLIPITTSIDRIYPFEVFISKVESGLQSESKLKCNQVRTVDKLRLVRLIGQLSAERLTKAEEALLIHMGISKLDF